MAKEEHKVASVVLNVVTAVALIVALVAGITIATRSSSLPLPPSADQTLAFSPDGSTAYVAENGIIGVERLNGKGVKTQAQISVPGGMVSRLAITRDGRRLLAATGSGLFSVSLTSTPPAVTQIYAGDGVVALAMAPDGTFALVGLRGATGSPGVLARINLSSAHPSLVDAVKVGYGIAGLAIVPTERNAFVLHRETAHGPQELTTLALGPSGMQPKGSLTVAGGGLLLSPSGDTAYVGGAVIDTFDDPPTLAAPPSLPQGFSTLAGFTAQSMTPSGRFVYLSGGQVTGEGGATQVVEDTSTSPPTTSTFALTDCNDVEVNPTGTHVYCGAALSFPVVPTITSLSLPHGGTAGGYPITLQGSFFTGATSASFGQTPAVITSVSRDGTSLVVNVPPGAVGTVPVTVSTPGGTSAAIPASEFTYALSPDVSSITPSRGLIQGGTGVLLGGSGFTSSSTVEFGPGHLAQVLSVTADGKFMAVRAPAGTGTVNVIVTSGLGSSAPSRDNRFRYVKIAPLVQAIHPASGSSRGGYGILIGGQYFNAATSVHFGVTPATNLTVSSDGKFIGVTVPPGVGTVDVTVTTPSGTSDNVVTDEFTYTSG